MPIYDNPKTRRREAWVDGELVWWIAAELLDQLTIVQVFRKWGTYPPPPADSLTDGSSSALPWKGDQSSNSQD